MKKHYLLFVFIVLCSACDFAEVNKNKALVYFFDRPAAIWEETLPLGNGRIGMMPDGGITDEKIVLNEISMWSGSRQDADNPSASWYLPRIRGLLFEGRNREAQELMYKTFVCKGEGSALGNGANAPYGCYQLLGNLTIHYDYADKEDSITGYRRELDLKEARASVSFKRGAVTYLREAFTSFASDLGVVYLTADMDKMLNFSVKMNRPERYGVRTEGSDLLMEGQLNNGVDGLGVKYGARVRILLPKGGQLVPGDSLLTVKNASEAILLVGMGTDYFGEEINHKVNTLLSNAQKKNYSLLKREHTAAYQKLFNRVDVDFGQTAQVDLPINQRLQEFQQKKDDPSLMALYFQFGRYLLISSTRPGLLPPNLQGLWCNSVQTPWNGDYHLDINLQMNLWPAEVGNLPELQMPLVEWIKRQVASGEQTARVFYGARGWVTHILGNVWEFTAPGEHPSWGATNTSAAWLCEHLYTHFQFNRDTAYLKDVYPVMRSASLFFVDMLVEDPRSHYLVTAPTTSPENSYRADSGAVVNVCAGSTMDNQIVRELFTNTIEAAAILKTDTAFVNELIAKRARLKPTTIGADGRIMEWLEPFEEVEPHHRHVSHLYGLYPGNEISLTCTPALAAAARKSLEVRGDQSTGWSMAWKVNFWARLRDGEHAYKLLTGLLRPTEKTTTNMSDGGGSYPNLFCAHPPFQIDGNFGGCAGIAEMLVQSQHGVVEFLPAMPSAWKTGSFSGLKVRGGGEVAAKWRDGVLTYASLKADVGGSFRIILPKHSERLSLRLNQKSVSLPVVDGGLTLNLRTGDEIALFFE